MWKTAYASFPLLLSVRNKGGKEGFVPANYVREVSPLVTKKPVKKKTIVNTKVKVRERGAVEHSLCIFICICLHVSSLSLSLALWPCLSFPVCLCLFLGLSHAQFNSSLFLSITVSLLLPEFLFLQKKKTGQKETNGKTESTKRAGPSQSIIVVHGNNSYCFERNTSHRPSLSSTWHS